MIRQKALTIPRTQAMRLAKLLFHKGMPEENMHDNSRILAQISNQLFQTLVRVFPVTSASDEFHEFPQIVPENPCWDRWDCF